MAPTPTHESTPITAVTAEDQALAELRRLGQRVTAPRRAVIAVLAATDEHLSAAQVAERAQALGADLHLASVYRALETLIRLRLVVHTHLAGGSTTYHLTTDSSPHRHVHAQCVGCGAVVDVPEEWLSAVSRRMARELDFELAPHHAALSGRCARCTAR
ncbi:MAG: transcriptional repressor [Nocardioidaceae bacterium]|nr:transcriptional repressor [Nocardioidaceae bacterium]